MIYMRGCVLGCLYLTYAEGLRQVMLGQVSLPIPRYGRVHQKVDLFLLFPSLRLP